MWHIPFLSEASEEADAPLSEMKRFRAAPLDSEQSEPMNDISNHLTDHRRLSMSSYLVS